MEKKNIVLIPTDFSEVCNNAISYGARLAEYLGLSVMLLHIIDKKTRAELKKDNLPFSAVNKKLETLAKETSKKYKIETGCISREGSIFSTIGEVARETAASLLILGTHGKVGIQQKIGGSFAKKVLVTSPVPVIVVQKGSEFNKNGFTNIVFPVSTTAEVRQKMNWAIIIANTFKSKIHLFQLHQPLEEDRMKMQVVMKQMLKEFDKHKISFTHIPAKKGVSFSKQVQAYANDIKAELITIMTTPDAVNFILEPYDEKVILNPYEIPVLCVNPVETVTYHWL